MPRIARIRYFKRLMFRGNLCYTSTSIILQLHKQNFRIMKNLSVFTIGLMLILVPTACKKDDMDPATVPLLVKTSTASDITEHSVKLSSTLQSDGASPITDYGHVYSETNATPSLKNCIKIPHGSFSGVFPDEFSSTLNVLKSNTTYHVRPYATNKVGTSYGDVLDIKTNIASPTVVFESNVGVDDLTGSSFKVTSTISSNGTVAITQHGHVYGPNNDPTLEQPPAPDKSPVN